VCTETVENHIRTCVERIEKRRRRRRSPQVEQDADRAPEIGMIGAWIVSSSGSRRDGKLAKAITFGDRDVRALSVGESDRVRYCAHAVLSNHPRPSSVFRIRIITIIIYEKHRIVRRRVASTVSCCYRYRRRRRLRGPKTQRIRI